MRMAYVCGCAVACAVAAVAEPVGHASEPRADFAKLFAVGVKNTPPAVESAREQAVAMKRAKPADLRIDYAYGLVLAKQGRYEASRKLLARFSNAQPDLLAPRRVKLWTELQEGQFDAALDSMSEIGDALSRRSEESSSDEQLDTAMFLGTCLAYLELAQPKRVSAQAISAAKSESLADIGEEGYVAFEEGYRKVVAELDHMDASRDARLKRAEEAAAEKAKAVASDLNSNLEKVAAQRESAQASTDTTRESMRELRVVQQQLASLAQDRALVGAQIVTLQAQLAQLQQPTSNAIVNPDQVINRAGPRQPGDVLLSTNSQNQTTIPLDRMAQAQSLAFSLAGLNKQAFDMDRLMLGLQTRGAELAGVSQAEFQKLAESQAAAEKAAKRAEKLSKQLERQEADAKKRPSGPTGRMTQFSTYAPLPYEQETKRVLGWFEK